MFCHTPATPAFSVEVDIERRGTDMLETTTKKGKVQYLRTKHQHDTAFVIHWKGIAYVVICYYILYIMLYIMYIIYNICTYIH